MHAPLTLNFAMKRAVLVAIWVTCIITHGLLARLPTCDLSGMLTVTKQGRDYILSPYRIL